MTTETPGESAPFELKGSVATLTVLRLVTNDLALVEQQLEARIAQVPRFFHNAPVVVDVELLKEAELEVDFSELVAMLRRRKLVPVAVRNVANEEAEQAAVEAGLGVLEGHARLVAAGDEPRERVEAEKAEPEPAEKTETEPVGEPPIPAPVAEHAGMVVRQPARGGRIVYAQQRDLVMLAPVNAGAEVIADGNIHVYGPLRGRALAGAHGNERARIFCSSLDAELVSIAGHYLRADEIPTELRGKAAQIVLDVGKLQVRAL